MCLKTIQTPVDVGLHHYNPKKQKKIVRIRNDKGRIEDKLAGDYVFEDEWQSFHKKRIALLN